MKNIFIFKIAHVAWELIGTSSVSHSHPRVSRSTGMLKSVFVCLFVCFGCTTLLVGP